MGVTLLMGNMNSFTLKTLLFKTMNQNIYDSVVEVYQGKSEDDFDIGCELFYEIFSDIDWTEEVIKNA